MSSFILVFDLLFAAALVSASVEIAYGTKATLGELPYQVAFINRNDNQQFCGGTLISSTAVLSAAHCFDPPNTGNTKIAIGRIDLNNANQGFEVNVAKVINHPNYDRTNINNDVSVVFLANSIPESANIKYAAIATSVPAQQTNLVVSGFGLTQSGSASSELLKVTVPVQADSVCSIPSTESHMKFCAGDPPSGKDSCQGDSGGPLGRVEGNTFMLYGIVSYGPQGCGVVNEAYGVYAKVSYFKPWFEQVMSTNGSAVDPITPIKSNTVIISSAAIHVFNTFAITFVAMLHMVMI